MFKAISLTICCIWVMTSVSCAETQPPNATPAKAVVDEKPKSDYPSLKTQAEEVGKVTINGNFEKLVDLTHPVIVEKLGGEDKMVAFISKDSQQMKADGILLLAMEVGQPSQIEKIEKQVFALLPIKMTMKTPEGKFLGESALVGISDDDGKSWKFISSIDQARFNSVFPKAGEKIKMPEEKPPTKIGESK